jgi:predicted murein hydrolase (TIGR00659 family)
MNKEEFFSFLITNPLTWMILTLSAYKIGVYVYEKTGKHSFLQPIAIAYVIMIPILLLTQIPYEKYFQSVSILHFFLAPATVALALPLYKNLRYIKAYFIPIVVTLFLGGVFTITSAVFILWLFDAQVVTMLSISTKSITAPIAIITAQDIGAIPSLAVGFVVITGLLGALFGSLIFKLLHVKHEASKGFALGLISHAIGIARAVEISESAAAFAAVAMGLCGIFTAILLPIVIALIS